MKLKLRIETTDKEPQTVELDGKESYSLGRTSADIVIDEARCSRMHALFFTDGAGQLQIRDMDSRNGTVVGGKKIEIATLKVGDAIKVGATTLTIEELTTKPGENTANPTTSGPASSILIGWPHAIRAIPKEKLENYIDMVDDKSRKKSARLKDIDAKKKKKTG